MFHVPKIIMQTWKTKEVPEKWKPSVVSIKKHMRSWKYVLMTDQDNLRFVKKHFPHYLKMFKNFKYPIQRADAIRYMWLYIHGGVYMDLDYIINKPLDCLFENKSGCFFTTSSNFNSSLTNSFMASSPKQKVWLDILEAIIKRQKGSLEWWAKGKHFEVMMTTGPGLVDKVVKKRNHIYTVLPSGLINPYSICDKVYDKDSFLTPLEGCSWGASDTKIGNWIFCHLDETIFLLITLFLLIIAFAVYYFQRKGEKSR